MNIGKVISLLWIAAVALLVSSCLGSEDVAEPSAYNLVRSCQFGAPVVAYTSDMVRDAKGQMVEVRDTVSYPAENFTFTIDQVARMIYLRDSLPYGSRVDKMPITITSAGAYGVRFEDDGNGGEREVVWSSTDSLDLTKPVRIKVYASDEVSARVYTITVPVHQVEPDSLMWHKVADSFSSGVVTGLTRTVVLGDELVTLAETDGGVAVYKNNWRNPSPAWSVTLLGADMADAVVGSAQVFGGQILMTNAGGKVMASADGINWSETALAGTVQTLVGAVTTGGGARLVAIVDEDGTRRFRLTADCQSWTEDAGDVPAAFPVNNFTGFELPLATNSRQHRLCVMGTEDPEAALNDTTSFAWYTLDGIRWTEMEGASTLRLPKLELPTLLHYAGETWAFGTGEDEKLTRLFTSEDYGLVWREKTRDARLDYSFEGRTAYSAAVDGDGWLWMVFSSEDGLSDEVWRGRVNRLGFAGAGAAQ